MYKNLATIIAVPTTIFLVHLLVIIYMLMVGSVAPGERMLRGIIAPTYTTAFIEFAVCITLIALAIWLDKKGKNENT